MKNKKIKIGGNNLLLLITIVLFIVMYGIGCVVYDDKGFGHFQTFLNLLITNAGLICVACGMTCVMLTGGIDISVGSLVGLDCMIMAYGMTNLKWSPFVAIAVVLIVGIVFGAVQGFLIGVLGSAVHHINGRNVLCKRYDSCYHYRNGKYQQCNICKMG